MGGIKKYWTLVAIALLSTFSYGQITSGKITFERRTNLKKKFGEDERMKHFLTEENKIKTEVFELYFDENRSLFKVVENDDDEKGFMSYTTQRNVTYQNLQKDELRIIIDLFGKNLYVKDSLKHRKWQVTESKRTIGDYMCRKAIWQKNDSTRIYAWFSVDIVPSIGPEGFCGLPGAILGLASEDGGIIYFAKSVAPIKPTEMKLLHYADENKDVYSVKELQVELEKKLSGKPWGQRMIDDMFKWM
ncbi:MAG: GLPGLI family protein [Crocinitomicaceae bacterium]|nr:GLPGLI family protein [Crocinitomicaceae bacterium]MDG1776757.1 GLPGLI family protein [Crocinitomicaceae bacterium]